MSRTETYEVSKLACSGLQLGKIAANRQPNSGLRWRYKLDEQLGCGELRLVAVLGKRNGGVKAASEGGFAVRKRGDRIGGLKGRCGLIVSGLVQAKAEWRGGLVKWRTMMYPSVPANSLVYFGYEG
ncbi:hypothetical protein AgCh_017076 [Apium graveolens]